ncbi:MAG TPA: potassium channel protein [Candidatus Dormibacteraeota bacterium]|nr:potassium channel protein [Candidatus Dormibacteraeota bacterium]
MKGRQPHPLRRFRLPAALLAVVILYGIAGYMLIERWNLLDAFYMTIITISTVGYTEVHPLSVTGRLFTSTLIVVGVGTMLFGFGVIAETLTDNTFVAYRRERQLERALNRLRDHFIICGYGRIGTQIVAEFEEHKVPYAVIDNTEEALVRLRNEDRLHVEGDASSEEILQLAGIERARGLISAVDSDERAVYITLAARALKPDLYMISRAGRPESIRRLELAGANRVISPYQMAGHRMAEIALRPALVDVLDSLHHGEAEIAVEEMLVKPDMAVVGKMVAEAGLLNPDAAKLLAVRRREGELHVNPGPDLRLEEGDLLIALGSEEQLFNLAALLT